MPFDAAGFGGDGSMGGGCPQCSMFQRLHQFLMQPFTSAASNTEWVLFIGLVLIVALLWTRVLRQIQDMI